MTDSIKALYCDCHGNEKLAVIKGNKLVITDRRNRNTHTLVLNLTELVEECYKETK